MKATISFFFLLALLIPISLFGQILDGSNNISNQDKSINNSSNQLLPGPVKIGTDNTDEYGTGGANVFLGGLGSTGGYFAVPDPTGTFNLTSSGTIEAWVCPTGTTSSSPGIVAKGETTSVAFLFGWSASTSLLYFRIGGSPTTNSGGTTVPVNQWSHVAVTWTGTAGNYILTFYVNGAVSGAPATNAGTWNSTNDSLTVGITKPFGGNTFYGYVDEVKIWNTVRTQTQIAQSRFVGLGDYTGANTGSALTSAANYTGLLSSWTFNNHYRDDIGGYNGFVRNSAGLYWYGYMAGNPIPYNYVLSCSNLAGANDYVTIPDNTVFDQTSAGTFEAWIYLNAVGILQPIFQKGNSFATTTLAAYVTASNKFGINIGGHNNISTGPATFVANKWYHVAATWSGGPNFTVNLYVNGVLDFTLTYNIAMPTASGPAWIGRYYGTQRFNGYIDEVRYWAGARTNFDIIKTMFASCRSILPNANLVGAWNFDGNLKNFSATAGIDGSFNTGGGSNLRLSGYLNESTTGGVPNVQFITHSTVLNCTAYPNGYQGRLLNVSIPDNATMTDTLTIANIPGNLTDVKVGLAIRHQKTSDLTIKLKAPNNTEIILSNGNGGTSANGYFTVFDDSAAYLVTSTAYLSPWTNYVKPQNPMTTFGGTAVNGNWVLTVIDGAATNTGTLVGWTLRFNGATLVNSQNISSNVPDKFDLCQNYPNPFNPVTKIKYQIPTSELVKLAVYDILGREIKILVNNKLNAGIYEYELDASNLSSGVYFYKMEAGNYINIKKMILIK